MINFGARLEPRSALPRTQCPSYFRILGVALSRHHLSRSGVGAAAFPSAGGTAARGHSPVTAAS